MTGFTDRKRFNFKSLHYDWGGMKSAAVAWGGFRSECTSGLLHHNHHKTFDICPRLLHRHFSFTPLSLPHTFTQKWPMLLKREFLNEVKTNIYVHSWQNLHKKFSKRKLQEWKDKLEQGMKGQKFQKFFFFLIQAVVIFILQNIHIYQFPFSS